jgi:OOP family OmpA-OmpF porin
MKPIVIFVTALIMAIVFCGTAVAQRRDAASRQTPAPVSGIYVGGSLGYGGYRTTFNQTHNSIATTGATAWNVNADTKHFMWKGYLGYRFTRYLSVEGGYWDFGGPSYTADIQAPVTTSMHRTFSGTGIGASAVVWLPFGDVSPTLSKVSGFAKLGAMNAHTTASSATPGGGLTPLPEQSSTNVRPHYGVGVEYSISRDIGARLEFEAVNSVGDNSTFGTADIQMWSLGANYRF